MTRADIDSRAVVWMTVSLGVRTELVDVVIRWRTTDLAIVPEMTDRLDDLLASIHVQPVTEGQLT